jgi:hypothetical protein
VSLRVDGGVRIVALCACGSTFHIECADEAIAALVEVAFGGLIVPFSWSQSDITGRYQVERSNANTAHGFCIRDVNGVCAQVEDTDDLLWHLDKSLTLALQHRRPDLYFLHAAAVANAGGVSVLAAPPGTGKSTLTLGLLERGLTYLSDELAPIDIGRRLVHHYAHAVGLKSPPPDPLRLPQGTVAIGSRFHVPTSGFRVAGLSEEPLPLVAFIFPERSSESPPRCRRISASVATVYLLANALNALAHSNDGLDAAVTLARLVPCFQINIRDLSAACAEIHDVMTLLSGGEEIPILSHG